MNKSPQYSLAQLVLYFTKLGFTGFGGPIALVGYMHRDLVEKRKWISEEDYKEGLALAPISARAFGCSVRHLYWFCSL